MAPVKPVILTVDDDVPVLRAIERDLRARYGKEHRVVAASSGAEALEAVVARTPLGRTVTTDEIVGASTFLLENGGVNGVTLEVDGGWMLQ